MIIFPRNHKALVLLQNHPDRFASQGSVVGGIKTAGPRLTTDDDPEQLIPKFPLELPPHTT